ncbi:MAG: calcium-binding protein [Pseudomonadota bacterium]
MSFTLFWEAVDIDGANTLNDGTFDLGVWIDTPSNGSHHPTEWVIGTDIIGDRPTIQSANVKDPTEIEVGFEREITGLSFELYDVDQGKSWDDKVTILATNAAGDEVEVVFSDVEATHLVTGGTIEGEGNARASIDGPGAADSVTVTIAGPVSNIRILHDNGHDVARSGTVGMSDWTFDAVPPRDGIVSGTDDDDTIVVDEYVDRDGDEIDNEDALIPGDGPNDDRVEAGDGDDTVAARDGDDTVEGGEGNDTVDGGDGDDVLYGNDIGDLGDIIDDPAFDPPAPDPDPENDRDSLSGGDGDDQIFGQDDRDTLDGGDGNDTLDGGIDDDEITGGAGNDSVIGGQGDDVIDTGVFGAPDRGYPGLFPGDSDPRNDRDTVDGGLGDDVIRTGDDNDVIDAGEGDDTVNAGFDDDDVTAGEGDDSIIAGEGSDTVRGGDGDDTIFGGIGEPDDPINIIDDADAGFPAPDLVPDNGRDLLDGGDGDDEIFGEDDDDTLIGGDGNDTLDGGIDDDDLTGGTGRDSLVGGQGQDTLAGGAGADTLEGGDDEDLFRVSGPTDDGDDVIDGGAGGTDLDQIDISKLGQFNVDWRLENLVTDSNGNGFDGDLVF